MKEMENELKGHLEELVNKMECHSLDIDGEIDELKEKLNTLEELKNDAEDIIIRIGNLDDDIEEFISRMEEVADL